MSKQSKKYLKQELKEAKNLEEFLAHVEDRISREEAGVSQPHPHFPNYEYTGPSSHQNGGQYSQYNPGHTINPNNIVILVPQPGIHYPAQYGHHNNYESQPLIGYNQDNTQENGCCCTIS